MVETNNNHFLTSQVSPYLEIDRAMEELTSALAERGRLLAELCAQIFSEKNLAYSNPPPITPAHISYPSPVKNPPPTNNLNRQTSHNQRQSPHSLSDFEHLRTEMESQRASTEIQFLRHKIAENEMRYESLLDEKRDGQALISRLERQLQRSQVPDPTLLDEMNQQKIVIGEKEQTISDLKKTIQRLKTDLSSLNQDFHKSEDVRAELFNNYRSERMEYDQRINRLLTELDTVHFQNDCLRSDLKITTDKLRYALQDLECKIPKKCFPVHQQRMNSNDPLEGRTLESISEEEEKDHRDGMGLEYRCDFQSPSFLPQSDRSSESSRPFPSSLGQTAFGRLEDQSSEQLDLENQLAAFQLSLTQLNNDKLELTSKLKQGNDLLIELKHKLQSKEEQLNKIEAESAERIHPLETGLLEKELADKKSQKQFSEEKSDLENTLLQLRSRLAEVESEKERFTKTLQDRETTIRELQASNELLVANYEKKMAALNGALEIEINFRSAVQKHQIQERERSDLGMANLESRLLSSKNDSERLIKTLEEEIEALKEHLGNQEKKLAEKEKEIERMNRALEAELRQTFNSKDPSEVERLSAEILKREDKILELEADLEVEKTLTQLRSGAFNKCLESLDSNSEPVGQEFDNSSKDDPKFNTYISKLSDEDHMAACFKRIKELLNQRNISQSKPGGDEVPPSS